MVASTIFVLALSGLSALATPLSKTYDYLQPHDGNAHRHPTNELDVLFKGNTQFKTGMKQLAPDYLELLATDGQKPPFMFLGCSDSRVSEGTIFSAKPGTIFSHRNIANQFHIHDPNANSVVSYAISALGVKHVIVMGHYGCGGIAAAMASRPPPPIDAETAAVQAWISPIRELYAASTRKEIVQRREKFKNSTDVGTPTHDDPAFRALIEENVKDAVQRISRTSAYKNHLALLTKFSGKSKKSSSNSNTFMLSKFSGKMDHVFGNFLSSFKSTVNVQKRAKKSDPVDVFIHGWVFDVKNGEITDLGVSVGPPGKDIPKISFPKAKKGGSGRNLFGYA